MIANKHSNFADQVHARKEDDIRNKDHAMQQEKERIDIQNKTPNLFDIVFDDNAVPSVN